MSNKHLLINDKIQNPDLAAHKCRTCLMCADPERRRCARDRMLSDGIRRAEIDRLQLSNKIAH
ncbi:MULTISPECIES: hypothetical protein [Roseobacteraceae]|uniref:hypothetical protein n=1 Tax=Roseobacteraceae TaxID=2854170 RepID=UPI0012F9ADCF|nr:MULTISPECIES: hypothetical protein [Roseobacteraceae]MCA0996662.1 hypothetical protein [Alloyangia pacifica]